MSDRSGEVLDSLESAETPRASPSASPWMRRPSVKWYARWLSAAVSGRARGDDRV
jgi:hypothetical protein